MVQIGDKIVSIELFQTFFMCDLKRCLGACCIHGDSGAPLERKEAVAMEAETGSLSDFLSPEGNSAIEKQGAWVTDDDGDMVTPLIDGKECAYTVFEDGIAKCGIENAYRAEATALRKPVSCHLYPIRVTKVGEYIALNYHRWHICEPARESGRKEGVPVFRFLKEPIIRVWGGDFYNEMEKVYDEIRKSERKVKSK